MGRGPDDRAGGETLRQFPIERSRITRAGIDPVAVPVFDVVHFQRDPERLAGLDRRLACDEFDRDGAFCNCAGSGGQHERGQAEKKEKQAGKFHLEVRVGRKRNISTGHIQSGRMPKGSQVWTGFSW